MGLKYILCQIVTGKPEVSQIFNSTQCVKNSPLLYQILNKSVYFSDEDEDFKKQVQQLRESMPFAVVGANAMVEIKGKKIRGRQYPWGIVEVENPSHCDFVKLRTMLITHMQDLQVNCVQKCIINGA